MLLVIALVMLLLLGGLGLAPHVLWLGLILGLILVIAHVAQRGPAADQPQI